MIQNDHKTRNKSDYFDSLAQEYDELWTARLYDDLIINKLPNDPKLVIDLGCGTGALTYKISQTAEFVRGYDISTSAIQIAKNKYKRVNLEYNVQSIEGVADTVDENSIDVIVAAKAIHHCHSLEQLLPNILSLLGDKGRIITLELYNNYKFTQKKNKSYVSNLYYVIWVLIRGIKQFSFLKAIRGILNEKKLFSKKEWIDHMENEPSFYYMDLKKILENNGVKVTVTKINCKFVLIVGEKK